MDRIPVPHPTSSTTLSLKRCLFCTIAFMYERVRTSSFCAHHKQSQRPRAFVIERPAFLSDLYVPASPRECLHYYDACQRFKFQYKMRHVRPVWHTMVVVAVQVNISNGARWKRVWCDETTRALCSPVEVVLLRMGHLLELQLGLLDVHLFSCGHCVDDCMEGSSLGGLEERTGVGSSWLGCGEGNAVLTLKNVSTFFGPRS